MRRLYHYFLILVCFPVSFAFSQGRPAMSDSLKLFEDEKPLQMTITTDLKTLLNKKPNEEYMDADIEWHMPDSSVVKERIKLRARGHTRREMCGVPPLKLSFEKEVSPILHRLDKIEITCTCRPGGTYEQLVYKEYMVYKMYNMVTPMSQRVRLVDLTILDSIGKRKPVSQPAFIIEELDDVAKRNGCKEVKIEKLQTENTDRDQMTVVAIFEFMIGNTDWSVYANHNIKLISDKDSVLTKKPYAVAYDFDYSGIVNAPYAIPDPMLGIATVQDRVYRGFPRSVEELIETSKIFYAKKDAIYQMIDNSLYLSKRSKNEMSNYLKEFFNILEDTRKIKREFIDNARQL